MRAGFEALRLCFENFTARPILIVALYLFLANAVACAMMWADKRRSFIGAWRYREVDLLLVAWLGGVFGAKLAQRRFRHKTRKQPFAFYLNCALCFYIIAFVALAIFRMTRFSLSL